MNQAMWRRANGMELKSDLHTSVEEAIRGELAAKNKLRICIGTDSQVKGDRVEYATVVVFVREKRGGFMFINKYHLPNNLKLKERMITEVSKSIEVAYEIFPVIEKYGIPLEIHADINSDPSFKSHSAFKEAMGYILGMGYIFKAKPDAFASSICADKMV